MQTFVIRALASDVLNAKFLTFNIPNIKNTLTSNVSNAKKKKKKLFKNTNKKIIFYSIDYSLRLTLFVLFEKSNVLKEHHLLSYLLYKNI